MVQARSVLHSIPFHSTRSTPFSVSPVRRRSIEPFHSSLSSPSDQIRSIHSIPFQESIHSDPSIPHSIPSIPFQIHSIPFHSILNIRGKYIPADDSLCQPFRAITGSSRLPVLLKSSKLRSRLPGRRKVEGVCACRVGKQRSHPQRLVSPQLIDDLITRFFMRPPQFSSHFGTELPIK